MNSNSMTGGLVMGGPGMAHNIKGGPGVAQTITIAPPAAYQQALQGAVASMHQDRSMADQIGDMRKKIEAQVKVLEYIQAQLNLDLFKSDPSATELFSAGMAQAAREVVSRK